MSLTGRGKPGIPEQRESEDMSGHVAVRTFAQRDDLVSAEGVDNRVDRFERDRCDGGLATKVQR